MVSCDPASDGHTRPSPRCPWWPSAWEQCPSTWDFLCPARRCPEIPPAAAPCWDAVKSRQSRIFQTSHILGRNPISSFGPCCLVCYGSPPKFSVQEQNFTYGSKEGFRQQPPPTHASKTCNFIAFLQKASSVVWSASSVLFLHILCCWHLTSCLRKAAPVSHSFHVGMHSAFYINLLFRGSFSHQCNQLLSECNTDLTATSQF